ncbi:MAG: nicotinamide mononucleotide transporter [Lachnospiraceae bacterium]|nr:nicotinamide mononucleotide transporter [Lachnospiraceae bacterium]
MKKYLASFKTLTKFEKGLWLTSLAVTLLSYVLSYFFSGSGDLLNLIASLIGVTALIFVAKGLVLGQLLTVVFSVFYGIISVLFAYYGEMITYLFMTTPMAIVAAVEWIKNPYKDTLEVKVHKVTKKQLAVMWLLALLVTVLFYFILKALNTANLFFSTVSITTSFVASYLTFLRSPYYAIGYSANDVVLIVLWILASVEDISYLPMVACFIMFLFNDLYGFYNWRRMHKRQK